MKPFRGKRTGTLCPPFEFNPWSSWVGSLCILLSGGSRRTDRSAAAGALSSGGAPRPFRERSKTVGEGGLLFGVGVIAPTCRRLAPGSTKTMRGRRRGRRIVGTFDLRGLLAQCFLTAFRYVRRTLPLARGPWLIGRQPVRPVLKHGPRSLTRARVAGLYETRRRNKSE